LLSFGVNRQFKDYTDRETTVRGPRHIDHEVARVMELGAALAAALGPGVEVVVHDLARLPASIVSIHGSFTGRAAGDPATNVLLELVAAGDGDHLLGYEGRLPDGRRVRSSTLLFPQGGRPTAALCINVDLSHWESVQQIAETMLGANLRASRPEDFATSVSELEATILREAICGVGVPVALMRKEHKVAVVMRLRSLGMFLLRDGVDTVAEALGVSRFSIYNYLREEAAGGDTND
jgi:predicted transcriptional regulator YheO